MSWSNFYEKLKSYFSLHGNCYISPESVDLADVREWAVEQRKLFADGSLGADQISKLEAIEIDWEAIGPHWERWESHFHALRAFKDEHGHCDVSQLYPGLGPWLSSQRVMYRQGILHPRRIRLLESMGVEWNPSQKLDARWTTQFNKVKAFRDEHGHCNVPRRTMPDPGIWVSAQRTAYRKGTLSADRIKALEEIGFEWVAPGSVKASANAESE